jgi:acyl carrier protein
VPNKVDIERAVFRAIDRVNEVLPAGSELGRSAAEPLAGPGSKLDSMGMVNLIAAVEDEIAGQYGVQLQLLGAGADNAREPLETVGSLLHYLLRVLNA